MPTSTRFAVAVHILTALAVNDGNAVRSEQLASSASTNPTVIRRILSMLAEAGLTSSQLGYGGGATLAKPANQITLDFLQKSGNREQGTGNRKKN